MESPFLPFHKRFSIQEISIYKTGVEHSGKKYPFRTWLFEKEWSLSFRKTELLFPAFIRFQQTTFFTLETSI